MEYRTHPLAEGHGMDLSDCAKDLFVEAKPGQLAPLHFWLTNRINIPAAINTAIRIPTTNAITGCRVGLASFDLAPFCAAPMPNQKRSLSIKSCSQRATNAGELTAHVANSLLSR